MEFLEDHSSELWVCQGRVRGYKGGREEGRNYVHPSVIIFPSFSWSVQPQVIVSSLGFPYHSISSPSLALNSFRQSNLHHFSSLHQLQSIDWFLELSNLVPHHSSLTNSVTMSRSSSFPLSQFLYLFNRTYFLGVVDINWDNMCEGLKMPTGT